MTVLEVIFPGRFRAALTPNTDQNNNQYGGLNANFLQQFVLLVFGTPADCRGSAIQVLNRVRSDKSMDDDMWFTYLAEKTVALLKDLNTNITSQRQFLKASLELFNCSSWKTDVEGFELENANKKMMKSLKKRYNLSTHDSDDSSSEDGEEDDDDDSYVPSEEDEDDEDEALKNENETLKAERVERDERIGELMNEVIALQNENETLKTERSLLRTRTCIFAMLVVVFLAFHYEYERRIKPLIETFTAALAANYMYNYGA